MRADDMKAYRVGTRRQKTVTLPVSVLAGLDQLLTDGKASEDCAAAQLIAAISGYLGPQMIEAIGKANRDD